MAFLDFNNQDENTRRRFSQGQIGGFQPARSDSGRTFRFPGFLGTGNEPKSVRVEPQPQGFSTSGTDAPVEPEVPAVQEPILQPEPIEELFPNNDGGQAPAGTGGGGNLGDVVSDAQNVGEFFGDLGTAVTTFSPIGLAVKGVRGLASAVSNDFGGGGSSSASGGAPGVSSADADAASSFGGDAAGFGNPDANPDPAVADGVDASPGFGGDNAGVPGAPGTASAPGAGLGSPGGAVGPSGQGDGEGDGDASVICTVVHRNGDMPSDHFYFDQLYGSLVPLRTLRGYHVWGKPFARFMEKNQLAYQVGRYLALRWTERMVWEFRDGRRPPRPIIGSLLRVVGEPVCSIIGSLFSKETVEA